MPHLNELVSIIVPKKTIARQMKVAKLRRGLEPIVKAALVDMDEADALSYLDRIVTHCGITESLIFSEGVEKIDDLVLWREFWIWYEEHRGPELDYQALFNLYAEKITDVGSSAWYSLLTSDNKAKNRLADELLAPVALRPDSMLTEEQKDDPFLGTSAAQSEPNSAPT